MFAYIANIHSTVIYLHMDPPKAPMLRPVCGRVIVANPCKHCGHKHSLCLLQTQALLVPVHVIAAGAVRRQAASAAKKGEPGRCYRYAAYQELVVAATAIAMICLPPLAADSFLARRILIMG